MPTQMPEDPKDTEKWESQKEDPDNEYSGDSGDKYAGDTEPRDSPADPDNKYAGETTSPDADYQEVEDSEETSRWEDDKDDGIYEG